MEQINEQVYAICIIPVKALNKVKLPVGYEKIGIKDLYDGETFLKANNGKFIHNQIIPLLFKDPNSGVNYILIAVSNLRGGKKIINNIVNKHGIESYFGHVRQEDNDVFEYSFLNKFFFIGYQSKVNCVRINMLHQLKNFSKP